MELPLARTADRLNRARRISTAVGRLYLGVRANRWLTRRLAPEERERRWSSFHRASAEGIYQTAVELHGLILKGCQFLGTRADLLPREYVEVLSKLQDRVPPKPFAVVRRQVEHELGCELSEVFRSFSHEPVAAASLAQVHQAELLSGERVAVKVQYPEIARLVRGDLANLRVLLRAVGLLERDFDLLPLVEELGTYVPRELNFLSEARNAEAIAGFFKDRDDIGVPRVHWELTTRRLLVMEYVDGIKISDVEGLRRAGVDLARVARTLAEAWCEQILGRGFFHADPHPGNVFVEPRQGAAPRVVLLDFGLAKDLPPTFREGVVGVAAAILRRDEGALAEALLELGFETRDRRADGLAEIARFVLDVAARPRERGAGGASLPERLADLLPEAIRRNPIVRVPTHLVLLARVLALLAGVNRSLGTRLDLAEIVLPYVTPRPGRAAR
jgi:predicted unusual protein kinase regulating ubiquinone biosynthesis (AarF/ABC1/UbiB family)